MKKILNYMKAVLACLFVSLAFVACNDDDELGSADLGLGIKVFAPTHVVAGQPMTINGSGFGDVTEIEFPGGVTVTTFDRVTDEMLRLVAPAGISPEGGKIIIRNSKGEQVESRIALTLGKTEIIGFSKKDGEEIKGFEEITVYGTDMQFVKEVELLDADSAALFVPASDFTRLASNRMVLRIPNNIFTGTFIGKIWTYDGQYFNLPALAYEQVKQEDGGGHMETVKRYLWTNDGSHGEISWGGDYRFTYAGNDGLNECIAELPVEDWEIIKNGTFYLEAKGSDWVDMRITTGWWSTTWTGDDIKTGDERIVDIGEGCYSLEINFAGDPILEVIDQQHLLFTGGGYTPLGIYVLEQQWVGGGGHMEKVRKTFWKNGVHSTIPAPSWSGEGRFCSVSHVSGEETYAFSEEEWEILKTQPFRIEIEKLADWVNLRVTTGWWSTNYLGLESLNDLVEQDEEGHYFVEINLQDDPALLELIDAQHLLFTGADYKLLEIYQVTEEWVDGGDGGGEDGPAETVLWEGEAVADDWGDQPFILSDGGAELSEAGARVGQTLCFYITPTEENWNLQVVEGHWGGTYVDYNQGNWDLAEHKGAVELELTEEILAAALTQQWWGGAFLLNGDNVVCTKVTLR